MRQSGFALIVAAAVLIPAAPAGAVYTSATGGTSATMTGDSASDTLTIDSSGGLLRHNRFGDLGFNSAFDFDTGTAGDQTLPAGATSFVIVNAGNGEDTLQAGTAMVPAASARAQIILHGEGGQDTLIWDDAADAIGRAITFQGGTSNQIFIPSTGFSVTWSGGPPEVERIFVKAGSGADSFALSGSTAGVTSTIDMGPGADTVTPGSAEAKLNLLAGPVEVSGGSGKDALKVNDSATAGNRTFTLGAETLTRDGGLQLGFLGFQSLSLALGIGNDTLSAASDAPPFQVTGGEGADKLTGGGGVDTLDGGPGDDGLFSRDATVDNDICAAGADTVEADSLDVVAPDCETVVRPVSLVPPAIDTKKPVVTLRGLPKSVSRDKAVRGVKFKVGADEAASFEVQALGSARSATISKAFNVTLASASLKLAPGSRTVKLKLKRRLLGKAKRFTVQVAIVATDAAGNRTTVKRVVRVHP